MVSLVFEGVVLLAHPALFRTDARMETLLTLVTLLQVDEIFTTVVTSEQALARKVDSKSGVSTFDLLDFFIAILHVAAHR